MANDKKKRKQSDRVANTSFGSPAGEMGPGDRGAFSYIPQYTGNPNDSQNYLMRWRQYTHLYETSWEARKIIRIPVEDALRKPWVPKGIPEEMSLAIEHRLKELRFLNVLSRSMMLERLLGGCLTFLGLEESEDDPSKKYLPIQGKKLCFLNAIPVSRISKVHWENNPLSANYMRPHEYIVNGTIVDVSRCLVWDGDPLIDPSDYYLSSARVNMSGFGPSKLATIWDDIVKAIGTRQAAYQLIKTSNSIIMAIKDIEGLYATDLGKKRLDVLKEIVNSLSVYKAALVDADGVDISQQSASFGSVPELIITFIQILSAASDIPATRFLGQAPGGLNATGESDLENYYNVIDAIQKQRIEPHVRYIYDVLGYNMFPSDWGNERKKLDLIFPPLWNETAEQETSRKMMEIDNVLKLLEASMMSDDKGIEEINNIGALSVKLVPEDLDVIDDLDISEQLS